MDGRMLKAEAIVAGRKLYEVPAASGFCPGHSQKPSRVGDLWMKKR